jgi:hypothetical protein
MEGCFHYSFQPPAVSGQLSAFGRSIREWYTGAVKDFRELIVWQKAHELTLAIYRVTSAFPRDEMYGLTSQTRRSCSSIAANPATGVRLQR